MCIVVIPNQGFRGELKRDLWRVLDEAAIIEKLASLLSQMYEAADEFYAKQSVLPVADRTGPIYGEVDPEVGF